MHKHSEPTIRVMIAGIGGASLGTEILKSLVLAGGYEIYGCDISSHAYGHYEEGFKKTYKVDRDQYINDVIEVCHASGAKLLVPGGEQPMVLLGSATARLKAEGIILLSNSAEIIRIFSDKSAAFKHLSKCGIPIPKTTLVDGAKSLDSIGLPCIIKPSTDSGGSASVFFATSKHEAMVYAEFIRHNGSQPIAQEYIGIDEGEFTIGVLSLPNMEVVSSIALKRELSAKLSISYKGRGGIISSGYSQGYIDKYPDLCNQAENIAKSIHSCGPINIQGRVIDGILFPFEINPRFSASTYLRAMAGFNELDMLIRYFVFRDVSKQKTIQAGWYLRSLTEQYIPNEKLI